MATEPRTDLRSTPYPGARASMGASPLDRSADRPHTGALVLLSLQGLYFVVTGIWPLVSLGTFEAVTGPKTDDWLVQTVGALIAVLGATFLLAAVRRRCPPEVVFLAAGSALALAAVDVIFVSQRVIPPIYLADAGAEIVLVTVWGLAWALGATGR
jgi:uncharacterized membrane protein